MRPPLVTGATGFAGSHLIDHLLEQAPRVLAWGNPAGHGIPGSQREQRVSWSAVDITDTEHVEHALVEARPSAIYHLAGFANVHSAWQHAAAALRVNAIGTHALLAAVARAGFDIPVLVTGSALVYRPSLDALTEDSPIEPSSPYGVSKLAQEMIAAAASGRVVIARPFNHTGPRQSADYAVSSFARQIAEIEAGVTAPVLHVGNLDARRDLTDVRDTVRSYTRLVERGEPRRPYNVCCGVAYRMGDLLDTLVGHAKVPISIEIDAARLRPSDNPTVLGDPHRIRAETGWEARIPIEQTLSDLLDYWRDVVRHPAASP